MYVADPGVNVIFVFTTAQLTSERGTGLVPAAVFQIGGSTGILGSAFKKGNLYLADNGDAQIFVVNSATFRPPGEQPRAPRWSLQRDAELQPKRNLREHRRAVGLVFDTAGDLFCSNEGIILSSGPSVVEFAASSLTASGTPTPVLQFIPKTSSAGASISDPQGVSMDNLADLAASNDTNNSIAVFSARDLAGGGGAVFPESFLVGPRTTLNAPTGLTFGPNLRATP